MLANIVNGQPPPGQQPRTTLLVASPALLTQWDKEIQQHTNCGLKVMKYSAGTRIVSSHAETVLKGHDIVLTTYGEVMKSYPKNEPPIHCQTAEQKIAWWKDVYENNRGILHRMMFLRVVLDEAQAIKNHLARTSIACRALMAQHKWALSGTPILNSLTELYPYFKFLGVPHTGSFKIFKHNYCDTGDAVNAERLLVRLSQFMIRRTHADEMFGAPILKLPQADQSTYDCEFNPVERCIYDIVHARFAKRINLWAKKGDLDKSYSNALVMLLRLRQLTAHVLMLQFVMRDLLEREDLERIREVVNDESADSTTRRGRTVIAVRKQLDKKSADEMKKSAAKAAAKAAGREYVEEDDDSSADEGAGEDQLSSPGAAARGGSGGDFGKEYNFKPYLSNLRSGDAWEKIKKKAKCSYCGKQPREPWMTSCQHLICGRPCMEESNMEAAEQEKSYAPCKACGVTPIYIHILQADEDESPEPVAQGTRSKAAKQKEKQRKRRDREDIGEDWLASLGDDVLPSAKTIAVKAQIMNWTKENPGVKIIVYTQFLAM
jgi:SNF2 family DNA or RNA helicase